MICLICRQAETIDGLTSVALVNAEINLRVNQVPARVCPNCNEAYVEEEVVVQLLTIARQMSEAGILDTECEYGTRRI